jgi:hypothetical protein
MPDEVEPSDLGLVIAALLALRANGRGEKADLLVVADGGYFHLGADRQIPNSQIHARILLML